MIYKITNTETGDFYIGYSVDPTLRYYKHLKNALDYNSDSYLYRAMRKYGPSRFELTILEECDTKDDSDREKYWIAKLNPSYNMTSGGDGGDTSSSQKWVDGMIRRRSYAGDGNPNFGKRRGNSPNAKPVIVEGKRYECLQDARDYSGRGYKWIMKNGKFCND